MLYLDDYDLLWLPHIFVEDLGLRPSQYWLIRKMDYGDKFGSVIKGKGTALDMITSSVDWLESNGIEEDTIRILNEWLEKFGILIGMSESEVMKALDEYHSKTLLEKGSAPAK
jgi:hypothetical protein